MARIIFLGTAGSSSVVSKQLRTAGGLILQVEDLQFHIDPGPGTLIKARESGVNLHHTTALLVSDNNIIHCNDLNMMIEAMTHGGIEQRGVVLASKSVLQTTDTHHPFLTKYHQNLVEKIIPLEKNHKVGIELVEINALPIEQVDQTAIGFKFFCPKFTLSYTGNTIVTSKLIEDLSSSDFLILNVPFPGDKGKGGNLDTDLAIKIVSKVRPQLVILTHFGLEMLKADPLMEARKVQKITGIQTISARDGLAISLEGYGQYQPPIKGY